VAFEADSDSDSSAIAWANEIVKQFETRFTKEVERETN
jgi:hypothetical protein